MTRQGVFQAAAKGEAMNRRDHRLRAGIKYIIGSLPDRSALAAGAEAADVSTGDEAAAVAHQDQRFEGRVRVRGVQALDDALRNPRAERVDRRIVNYDDADIAVFFEAN